MHTHFDWAGAETSAGVDAVIVGPQNKISTLHGDLHNLLGLPAPTVFGAQIGDAIYLTAVGEIGKTYSFGSVAQVRPYVEAQVGAETLLRVGGDVTFGSFARDALMLRDGITGQRYRGVTGDRVEGLSLTMGGDIARIYDSKYFLAGDVATVSDTRSRLRAGVHWQGARSEAFYGLTWLGEEFDQQAEGQVVGSVNLRLQF